MLYIHTNGVDFKVGKVEICETPVESLQKLHQWSIYIEREGQYTHTHTHTLTHLAIVGRMTDTGHHVI